MADFQTIVVEPPEGGDNGGFQTIRLNRPEALNALNTALMAELTQALDAAEANDAVRCVILTGSEKAFAAGHQHEHRARPVVARDVRADGRRRRGRRPCDRSQR